MRLEALVFNGDHSLTEHRGKVVIIDHYAPLQRKGADDASLLVVEFGGGGGVIAFQVVNLRQIDGVDQHEPAQRAGNHSESEQSSEGKLAGQLAPLMRGHRLGSQQVAPAKATQLRRLDRGDSQVIQASSAFLLHIVEKCYSPRLADRKSTRLNSSHANISYAVFGLKQKTEKITSVTVDVALESVAAVTSDSEHY